MRIGQELMVEDIWSVTGESCLVTVLEIDMKGPSVFIKYPDGYTEWLPISAFRGY